MIINSNNSKEDYRFVNKDGVAETEEKYSKPAS